MMLRKEFRCVLHLYAFVLIWFLQKEIFFHEFFYFSFHFVVFGFLHYRQWLTRSKKISGKEEERLMMHQMQALAQKQVNPYTQNLNIIPNSTSIARAFFILSSVFHISSFYFSQTKNKKTILRFFVFFISFFLGQILWCVFRLIDFNLFFPWMSNDFCLLDPLESHANPPRKEFNWYKETNGVRYVW